MILGVIQIVMDLYLKIILKKNINISQKLLKTVLPKSLFSSPKLLTLSSIFKRCF